MNSKTRYDLIVVGSGISGLSAAVTAAEKGLSVCVLSKAENIELSNTLYAQGGIVADGEGDSPQLLSSDIISAGDHINSIEAVRLLAEEGPRAVRGFLVDKAGTPFCKAGGDFDRTREAAHSVRRIFHVKDYTGRAIEESLLSYARKNPRIEMRAHHAVIDVITNCHNSTDPQERYKKTRAIGVYALDCPSGEVYALFAGAILIASGGVGNLFQHTSNPSIATGDGIAMAQRAGAEIINAEFIQFHPTILYHRDVKRFLITESLRGEGARLMNREGEYFMERYCPELSDLAPRDEVSRAIYREMEMTKSEYVFLDAREIRGLSHAERFPQIYETCKRAGIDIERDLIPVVPAAHYFCGGIKVDIDCRTNIEGLFACGEAACTGVHGANRLASVSLLEGLYFGLRAGASVASSVRSVSDSLIASVPDWVYPREQEEFDPVLIENDLTIIQSVMWNYVGIIRTKSRLQRAKADLNYMSHRIEQFYKKAAITRDIIELRNAVLVSSLITAQAISNPKSVGCHYIL